MKPTNMKPAPTKTESITPVEAPAPAADLPEGIDLRELDLSLPEVKAKILEIFPAIDDYTWRVLWPEWRDHAAQVCTKCGHVIVAKTGECAAHPKEHKFKPYPDGYAAVRVTLH